MQVVGSFGAGASVARTAFAVVGRTIVFGPAGVAAFVAVAVVCGTLSARAATITVNATADTTTPNGNCTLREAVIAANTDSAVDACAAGNGGDIIVMPPGFHFLTQVGTDEDAAATGDLDLTDDVEIRGAGATGSVIDGQWTDRVLDVDPQLTGVTVVLSGLAIRRGGSSSGAVTGGGGIRNAGTLTIKDCVIESSRIQGVTFGEGGGILSSGDLQLMNTVVRSNEVVALFQPSASTRGAGIASSGSATVVDSTITNNELFAASSTSDIGAGGGIWSSGPLVVAGSTINRNTITTLLGPNSDGGGGGIASSGSLTLSNSTLTQNRLEANPPPSVPGRGGALLAGAATTINNCTIADNSSFVESVQLVGSPTVVFRNTILIGGCAGSGTVLSDAYNIGSDDSCGFSGTDLVGVDPLLGPLQNNGGPTMTRLPAAGSPALEAGSPAVPGSGGSACEATDQRRVTRPVSARCDVGSVEVENFDFCAFTPLPYCDEFPGKSLLLIKDKNGDGAGPGDKLIWKWLQNTPVEPADFGDPTATTDYTLCVYAGTTAVMRADVPPAGTCSGSPCWKPIGDGGYKRVDASAASSGIKKILLKTTSRPSVKILVRGQGAGLDLDAATLPLKQGSWIKVQLANDDNDECWTANYAPGFIRTNDDTVFKAKYP